MINASEVFFRIRARLDDDQSGRYDVPNDLVPAVNASINFWVMIMNAGFESKRLYHEALSDLIRNKIYVATVQGRTAYVELTPDISTMWTIFGVDPSPVVGGNPAILLESRNRWATRLSLKEWNDASEDPFSAGTVISIPVEFQRPSFIGVGNYRTAGSYHIMLRPAEILDDDKNVAVWYLKNPEAIVDGTSIIEFPYNMTELIVEKAINYISYQHGTSAGRYGVSSPYYQFTENELKRLISIISV